MKKKPKALEPDKYQCKECNSQVLRGKMLVAKNPFNKEYKIYGCPYCFEVDKFETLCDEPNCSELATTGSPSKDGYRWTCYKHRPTPTKP